eukprot:Lithocolla_globosa_v1_NODE_907_length_3099_cov_10.203679.p2 type:complete len:108 gc:universal NODE_907_length_3099_cov_10.203679:2703-3026(+)
MRVDAPRDGVIPETFMVVAVKSGFHRAIDFQWDNDVHSTGNFRTEFQPIRHTTDGTTERCCLWSIPIHVFIGATIKPIFRTFNLNALTRNDQQQHPNQFHPKKNTPT